MADLSGVRGTWVQTERAAHEAWAGLIGRQPRAAALLHLLVANMDRSGALVASQATLASLMGVSVATVKRALIVLTDECWIDVVRVGSERGGVNAYVVNRRVAWAD
ncbi:helix-turn-helix domain-containing protein, partial [Pseudomonas aeruginosa]|uniref:helix-turn-helix domain-containing protein n=3 Tax=Pseudomonas TaxID=286 RepID=UPI001C67CE78